MSDSMSSRLSVISAALLFLVVSCLLTPIGLLVADAVADPQAMTGSAAPDTVSDQVGATAAEFRVDESGAATYSIPLYGVPGTAGVAPQLTLNYSSQAGYGPLGKGWAIGGLSSISRCRATREAGDFISGGTVTDGNPEPINFTGSDRYCLDGQRLVPGIGGYACESVGGMTAQTLRTEIESFQRVCAYTPTGSANGPAFFTVERKDGSTSWYGDRDNNASSNRPDGYFNSTAAGKTAVALSWAQTRFQDSTGNYIDFVYLENPAGAGTGEHLISEVRYTGKTVLTGQSGSAKAPYAKLMFTYSVRPAAQWSNGYASGGRLTQSRRLDSITACASAGAGCSSADQARYYKLSYATSVSGSGFENLSSFKECRDSSENVCLAPTQFTWSAGRHEFSTSNAWNPGIFGSASKFRGMKLGDVNGDGRPDLVWLKDGGSSCNKETVNVAVGEFDSAGRSHFRPVTSTPYCTPNLLSSLGDASWQLIDYNGDGRDDLFMAGAGANDTWAIFPATDNLPTVFDFSNNLIASMSPAIAVHRPLSGRSLHPQLADLNGDGLLDVVYRRTTPPNSVAWYARLMTRSGNNWEWGGEKIVYRDVPTLDFCLPTPDYSCTTSHFDSISNGLGSYQLYDFNGDQASDLVYYRDFVVDYTYTGSGECYTPPPGTQFPPIDDDPYCHEQHVFSRLSIQKVDQIGSTSIALSEYALLSRHGGGYGSMTDGKADRFADFNGDGLTDRLESGRYLYLNNGVGFDFQIDLGSQPEDQDQIHIADVNGDGRADMLYPFAESTRKVFRARYGLATGGLSALTAMQGNNAVACSGSSCNPAGKMHLFTDLDADGQLDFFALRLDDNPDYYLSQASLRHQPRDVITGVTNGLGAQTDIGYAPLTNAAVYRRDTGSRTLNWGRGAPVQDLLAPTYVVSRASSSSPQAGAPAAMANVYYRYAGAKVQGGGRGYLGFREIATVDTNHEAGYVTTTSSYHQNFPYIGMPARTIKRAVASGSYGVSGCLKGLVTNACFATPGSAFPTMPGNWFSDSSHVWEADTDLGATVRSYAAGEQRPIHVRTAGTEEKLRDPFGGAQTSRVVTTFAYLAYGNVGSTTVDTYTGTSGTATSTVVTANAYSDNGSLWRLGRLTSSTVTHSRPNRPDVVRTASFSYQTSGAYTGLLRAERSQSGVGADQDLRKQYVHDEYGNRTVSMTCADPATSCTTAISFHPATPTQVQRYTRATYDSRGRYPVSTAEPFWSGTGGVERVTQTVVSRNIFGDVTEAVDMNGNATVAVTGTLGRPYYAWVQTVPGATPGDPNGGQESLTTYRWCGSGSGQVSCPTGGKFRQETIASGAPAVWTYMDVLGRPIMKASETYNINVSGKDVSAVCTDYNAAGQSKRVSNPFFLAGTAGSNGPTVASNVCTSGRDWNTTSFDVLGRPTDAVAADGSITSTDYVALDTLITDGRGNTTTQKRNGLGELTSVTDAAGFAQAYSYYADGSLYYTWRDAGRGDIKNVFYYDAAGRKIRQVDPDSGTTYFEYNALGELTAQQDIEGNRVENEIDARGRVWRRTVKHANGVVESQSTFEFDTAANGVGQLASEAISGSYEAWTGQSGLALDYSRSHSYDSMGRPVGSSTTIDGDSYATAVFYDSLGRPQRVKDASGRWASTQFNERGFARAVCWRNSTGCLGSTIPNDDNERTALINQEADAWGNIIRELRGQTTALEVRRSYHPLSGRISSICSGTSACALVDEEYAWDDAGNLHTQRKENRYLETFTYDSLNRLVSARLDMQDGVTVNNTWQSYEYDALGNICRRYTQGWAIRDYTYQGRSGCGLGGALNSSYGSGGTGTVGAHQAAQLVNGANVMTQTYDARGNLTSRDVTGVGARVMRYSLDNRMYEIRADNGGWLSRFWYGPDGQRYKQIDQDGRTTLYLGNVEIVKQGGATTVRRTLAGVQLQTIVGSTTTTRYLFHDHLGSVARIADVDGNVVESLDYLAHGGRRDPDTQLANGAASNVTPRGFTGHEMLDKFAMVHMNGRVYDTYMGRFMQPDPVIQAPDNPQSWNAYTYVFNNPLAYTDPTGMIGIKERQWLGAAVAIVGSVVAPYLTPVFGKLGTAVLIGAVAGGVSTGTWQGALYGAFSAAVFYGVGTYFENAQWAQATEWENAFGSGLSWGGYGAKVMAHGATGGVMAKLQGGRFGHGFASAGVTQAFAPAIDLIGGGAPSYAGVRVAAAAVLGGTAAKLSGGKFANGAVTAAFSRAFNDEVHQEHGAWSRDNEYDVSESSYHRYTEANAICLISENGCTPENVGALMLGGYNAPSFMLKPQSVAAPGDDRLLFATRYPGMNFPSTYKIPGGIINQVANPGYFLVTNITTRAHPLYPGVIDRIVVQSGGKVWVVTHGVGYNQYFGRPGAFANMMAGPAMFRDQDRALARAWRARYGH
ncbi:hypothetical protein FKV24_009355 [Lysobacter maris]|uniref:Insecticide toxin TcdB middle/N-terminal domain-containing protein n=1 Tax=Marilutibacter maris TaxID=1605891 RepID=A0A508AWP7_9GAMM|nr:FG-GAP-like repeat-containing protein [Lysobacter maris]KAB8189476.1 hypothetical protein FKV24_009355 [Lysobacter maris]